jgi:hypothetical protein
MRMPQPEIALLAQHIQQALSTLNTHEISQEACFVSNKLGYGIAQHAFNAASHDATLAQLERVLTELGGVREASQSAI